MNFCPHCGSMVFEGMDTCNSCGSKLNLTPQPGNQQMMNNGMNQPMQQPVMNNGMNQSMQQPTMNNQMYEQPMQQTMMNNQMYGQPMQQPTMNNQMYGQPMQQQVMNPQMNQTYGMAQPMQQFQSNEPWTNQKINDDVLIDAYIGPNAPKIKAGGFSSHTFFLGIYYLSYRKMWGYVALIFAINFVVTLIVPAFSTIVSIIIDIVFASGFNQAYVENVKEKIQKIKLDNLDKTPEELRVICQRKGGTSMLGPIIFIILRLLLIYIAYFL